LGYVAFCSVSSHSADKSKNMIVTIILNAFFDFLVFLVGFLPVGSIPTAIGTSLNFLFGVLNTFNYVIPISTMLLAALATLVLDGAILLWHFINWIIRKIPGMQ